MKFISNNSTQDDFCFDRENMSNKWLIIISHAFSESHMRASDMIDQIKLLEVDGELLSVGKCRDEVPMLLHVTEHGPKWLKNMYFANNW